jgi:hypothetical protein
MENRYVLNGKRSVVGAVMVTMARMCSISSWRTVLCMCYLCYFVIGNMCFVK